MNIRNHIVFNIISIFFIKNINIINISNIEWFLIFISSTIFCILPDIDHKNSFIGKKIIFSKYISKLFGHRKFTHSFIFTFLLYKLLILKFKKNLFYKSIINGLLIGFITHIILDMTTINGVYLFWPIKSKFKIKNYNLFLILLYIMCMYV